MFLKIITKLSLVTLIPFSCIFLYGEEISQGNTFNVSKETLLGDNDSQKKIEKIIVTGIGINQNKAIENASKTAIQQVVGMYVISDSVMKNRKLIKDEVLSTSNGFIKSFKTLSKSQNEDGLFEIEAEVEVEVNKLTRRLSDLNVDLKYVGTDNLKAVSLDKFTAKNDFNKMAKKVIFDPIIENKYIFDLKIVDFQPYNIDDIKRRRFSLKKYNNRLPFKLSIKLSTDSNYLNSVEQFIDKNSKESFEGIRKGEGINIVSFVDTVRKLTKRRYNYNFKYKRNYKMTTAKIDTLISLNKTYIYDLLVSIYNEEGLFKQSSLKRFDRVDISTGGGDFPIGPQVRTLGYLSKYLSPLIYVKDYPVLWGGLHKGFILSKNNLTFDFILWLNEDDIRQLKNIKIEILRRKR